MPGLAARLGVLASVAATTAGCSGVLEASAPWFDGGSTAPSDAGAPEPTPPDAPMAPAVRPPALLTSGSFTLRSTLYFTGALTAEVDLVVSIEDGPSPRAIVGANGHASAMRVEVLAADRALLTGTTLTLAVSTPCNDATPVHVERIELALLPGVDGTHDTLEAIIHGYSLPWHVDGDASGARLELHGSATGTRDVDPPRLLPLPEVAVPGLYTRVRLSEPVSPTARAALVGPDGTELALRADDAGATGGWALPPLDWGTTYRVRVSQLADVGGLRAPDCEQTIRTPPMPPMHAPRALDQFEDVSRTADGEPAGLDAYAECVELVEDARVLLGERALFVPADGSSLLVLRMDGRAHGADVHAHAAATSLGGMGATLWARMWDESWRPLGDARLPGARAGHATSDPDWFVSRTFSHPLRFALSHAPETLWVALTVVPALCAGPAAVVDPAGGVVIEAIDRRR